LIADIEKCLPVAIFKMAAQYEMALKSDNVEFVRYCGGHFENGDR
jgi:peptide subunit release factor RF-3